MYVAVSTYTAPINEIDYVLPEHIEWLERHYDSGDFLVSGRREPRVGGVIIARPMLRGKLDAILATDPFSYRHLARYDVYEFAATRTAPELNWINETVAG
ncbi:YciI family protein [Haloechinothrix sp. LS1_15]|uniref:YciI family protein n=1 Tax=Haloechinothrix sp. LS1_15 TaxID=2652248 RepID=UPI0029464963|nr:YciI family protein [Haloechinothrix sp. LS1_15]MDV6011547.1 hypothetical protein [Haloechinothrix sp. LS1_15]